MGVTGRGEFGMFSFAECRGERRGGFISTGSGFSSSCTSSSS